MRKIRRCCCYKRCCEKNINYSEMLKIVNQYSVVIIDVRSKQEYIEGHIDGAINIPLCDIKEQAPKVIQNKEKIIVAYCTSGIRSKKAQKILNSAGYTNVYNLKDGYK